MSYFLRAFISRELLWLLQIAIFFISLSGNALFYWFCWWLLCCCCSCLQKLSSFLTSWSIARSINILISQLLLPFKFSTFSFVMFFFFFIAGSEIVRAGSGRDSLLLFWRARQGDSTHHNRANGQGSQPTHWQAWQVRWSVTLAAEILPIVLVYTFFIYSL